MTQEDIIRMAREAGGGLESDYMNISALKRFAALVAAFEREACARVCENEWSTVAERMYGQECAAAIRARSEA